MFINLLEQNIVSVMEDLNNYLIIPILLPVSISILFYFIGKNDGGDGNNLKF